MSLAESIAVAVTVFAAGAYLARRAWMRFAGQGGGCCGRCPVAPSKIRLAAKTGRVSIVGK